MSAKPTTLYLLVVCLLIAAVGVVLFLTGDSSERTLVGPGGSADVAQRNAPTPSDLLAPDSAPVRPTGASARTLVAERVQPAAAAKAQQAAAPTEGPFLTGRVVDRNGHGVPGAEVRISADGIPSGFMAMSGGRISREAVTDADGRFRVPRVGAIDPELSVRAEARGFRVFRGDAEVDTEEGDGDLGDFELELAAVLGGVVVDADGRPVAEALVRRVDPDGAGLFPGAFIAGSRGPDSVETDTEGAFVLEHEEPGAYVLVVEHPGYPRGRFEGVTPDSGYEDLGLVLRLAPTASIAGRLEGFPPDTERVVVKALAQARPESEDADGTAVMLELMGMGTAHTGVPAADGSFLIEGLEAGAKYQVQAFQRDGIIGQVPASDSKLVRAGDGGETTLEWDSGARVSLRVLDAATQAHVEELSVRFRWIGSQASLTAALPKKREFAGPDVLLDELRPKPSPGLIELIISAPGYLDHFEEDVVVTAGKTTELGTIRMTKAPRLRLRVVDARTDEPLSRARVTVRPAGSGVGSDEEEEVIDALSFQGTSHHDKTDKDGWVELPAVSSATATITAKKSDYARYVEDDVPMPTQGTRERILRLVPGGEVEVHVVDTQGQPVADAMVRRATVGALGETNKHADSKGRVRWKDLQPGSYRFRAVRTNSAEGLSVTFSVGGNDEESDGAEAGGGDLLDEREWVTAEVPGGESVVVRIEVPSTAKLSGSVTSGGRPLAGASVQLLEGREVSAQELALSELTERMGQFMPGSLPRDTTSANGVYELGDVPVGRHRLRVQRADGTPPQTFPVEVVEGSNRFDVDMPSAAIAGRVLDHRGRPLAGARVQARLLAPSPAESDAEAARVAAIFGGRDEDGVATADDGSFLIEGVPPDTPVRLEATAPGAVLGHSESLEVAEGVTLRGVEVVLAEAGSIRVTLRGDPGVFHLVVATYEGEDQPGVTNKIEVVRTSLVMLAGLAPGPWRVKLDGLGVDSDEEEGILVQVEGGVEALVVLDL